MVRRKRTRVHLNNQISVSQVLAHLAHNEINQSTLQHAVEVKDPQPAEEEKVEVEDYVEKEQEDDGDLSFKSQFDFDAVDSNTDSSLLEESYPAVDLPAGDSHTAEEQLRVMLGGNFHKERSQLVEDDEEEENNQAEEDEFRDGMDVQNNEAEEDAIEIDAQEQAMLDLLQLCQDGGASLEVFDNLVTTLRRHGKQGFDIRKASRRHTFLDNLRKKYLAPDLSLFKLAIIRFQSSTY